MMVFAVEVLVPQILDANQAQEFIDYSLWSTREKAEAHLAYLRQQERFGIEGLIAVVVEKPLDPE